MLLLLLACSEYEVKGGPEDPAGAPAPDIEVYPPRLDFGAIPVGDTAGPETVTVRNVGGATLLLESPTVDAGAWTLTALGAVALAPGEETTFAVTFLAEAPGPASGAVTVRSDDPDEPTTAIPVTGEGLVGDLALAPATHDFGTLEMDATDAVALTLTNEGAAPVTVTALEYATASGELSLDDAEAAYGPLPWSLAAGEARELVVRYAPVDDVVDTGTLTVRTDDPDEPALTAVQTGTMRVFEGFSTGWYIVDDHTVYETVSHPSYRVDFHGDPDGYWYEPSGAHGLVGSADPETDFAVLRDYVIARAGAPTAVTGALTFRSSSSVGALTEASFSYILCDFWLDATDDPARYAITMGTVDDGVQVMVNGEILGNVTLGNSGSFALDNARLGEVNSLVVILMDNAAVDKYVYDLAFTRDGVIVSG